MGKHFEILLENLPIVASHPYAFVAYIAVLAVYFVIAMRVQRNRFLLRHIQKLPAKDRLAALKAEMGVPDLRQGLTPEQWLRSRIHSMLFYSAAMLVVGVFVIAVLSLVIDSPEPSVDMTLSPEPLEQ